MNTPRRFVIAPISLMILLAACAAPAGEVASPSPSATPDATTAPSGSPAEDEDPTLADPPDAPEGIPDEIWAGVLDELADADFDDAPTIVTAEAVTWSDGSLGCPQPDMGYTQALVPGYRVVLDVQGEELHFHASESGTVVLCDDPQEPIEGSTDR